MADKTGHPTVDIPHIAPLIHATSSTTSLSLSSQRILLGTFLGDRLSPTVYLTSLASRGAPGLQHTFPRSSAIRSIWTSSATPAASGELLLGTSTAAVLLRPHNHALQTTEFRIKSDVFATAFLRETPHPFLAGSRDGDMRLFDVRASANVRPDIVIRHGGTITHIRQLGETGVVVNGLARCASYDLRYPHPASPSAGFARATAAGAVWEGVVAAGASVVGLGFDVCEERGVMVAADQECGVKMWSLGTGERVRGAWDRRWEVPCRGLWFEGGAGKTERLWAAEGGKMVCFEY